jgi:hypothetical protein
MNWKGFGRRLLWHFPAGIEEYYEKPQGSLFLGQDAN